MIEIKGLSLTLKGRELLKDINMTINNGEVTGFIGPNGSGKTLLMKCICGFVTSYTGEILIDGVDIKNIPIKPMGIIIETPGFIPYYSGYKNLKILASINKKCTDKDINESMEIMGLNPKSKLPVNKYSLGMRQRLGVAQAFMENQNILILDEPFNSLDSQITDRLRQRIENEKSRNKKIILSSHDPTDIELLCDKKYFIDKGCLIKEEHSSDQERLI